MAIPQCAFVTLVSSDGYLPGALAVVAAINDLHPTRNFHTLSLVTPESVDVATIKTLRRAFDVVIGVEILEDSDERGLKLLGRPDLTTVLTKLHVFRLTQYSKIIFLDADVLPLRPLDHLFDITHEFSAVPDVGWPDIFNSGVLVLSPGEEKFNELNQLLKSKGSWDGGDQGLLNEWRGGDWNRLSFTYNTTPTAAYTYAPAYERYGSQISVLHFIGKNKPWNSIPFRSPFTSSSSKTKDSPQQAYDYDSLVDRWYAVYDKHYRAKPVVSKPSFEFKRYTSAWDASASPATPIQHVDVLDLDTLRHLTVEGVAASSSANRSPHDEGGYISLPLEGRIDLMRPRPEPVEDTASVEETPLLRGDQYPRFELEEDLPATPQHHSSALYGENEEGDYRWHTLPTPHPNDVPTRPSFQPLLLPSTPYTHLFEPVRSDFYASESDSEAIQADTCFFAEEHQFHDEHKSQDGREPFHHPPLSRPRSRRTSQSHGRPPHLIHPSAPHPPNHSQTKQHEHRIHTHAHSHRHSPIPIQAPLQRPASPPLLTWNAALDPPPNNVPSMTAFPTSTYFPNLWDQPQPRKLQKHSGSSINFFQVPPIPPIPQTLIKQGHYKNVTGEEDSLILTPDLAKVKSIFPWEEKPRAMPKRVFPDADTPQPALFLNPESVTSQSSATPSTPEQSRNVPLTRLNISPPLGLPPSLTYSNAWDTVPSIQKYASKLVRPQPLPPTPFAPALDDGRWRKPRKKSWDERAEASSRDGDDEDNGDDEEEDDDDGADGSWGERSRRSSGRRAGLKPRVKIKKDYRDQAVQTESAPLRSQGTQTEKVIKKSASKRQSIVATSPSFLAPPSTRDAAASTSDSPVSILTPVAQHALSNRLPKIHLKSAGVSPTHSPRVQSPARSPAKDVKDFIVPPVPPPTGTAIPAQRPTVQRISTPHSKPVPRPQQPVRNHNVQNGHASPSVSRQTSNDSSLTSAASSSPSGILDPQLMADRPVRIGGRVFDPARGVEIFKRGSEEVLARFLRMGNLENPEAPANR